MVPQGSMHLRHAGIEDGDMAAAGKICGRISAFPRHDWKEGR
jgi:hypothetical protein